MSSKPASRNLFVAGLHPSITDPILEHAFTSFGTVVSAKVMVDLITAKSRRFRLRYDDGDEESLDAAELIEALKLYQKSSKIDSNPDAAAVPSPGAGAANAASQRADDDDEKEEDAAVAAAVAIAAEGHSNDDGGAVHPESSSAGAAPLEPPIE